MSGATMECAPLAAQCMEFCRHLESQGRAFKFSLSIGVDFAFTLDTREEATTLKEGRKKLSPSSRPSMTFAFSKCTETRQMAL